VAEADSQRLGAAYGEELAQGRGSRDLPRREDSGAIRPARMNHAAPAGGMRHRKRQNAIGGVLLELAVAAPSAFASGAGVRRL
jgi:hypothetical protein